MSRLILTATALRGAGALAWLAYTWLLARLLPSDQLGTMLTILALSGLLAGLLTAGWAQLLLREGSRLWATAQAGALTSLMARAFTALALRGFALALLLGAVFGTTQIATLPQSPITLCLSIALPLLLALLGLLASARRAQGALVPALLSQGLLRAALPLASCALYAQFAPLTLAIALCIYAAGVLLCLPLAWPLSAPPLPCRPDRTSLRALTTAQAGWMLLGHLDVIVLTLMASPTQAALYLVARRLAGLLALLFDALRSALAPALSRAYHQRIGFGGLAARTNLGFFLIGGGAATGLVVLGPLALPLFGAHFAAAASVLIWLTLGQAAPALFGATGMLMTMTDMERPRAVLIWIAIPTTALAQLYAASQSLHELAVTTALCQLVFSGVCAAALAHRHGILPGLTALLHPKLRFKA
ncbi:lipopolysaccharide biosynthesis protein [Cognatishimia sp. MH4019]|uniref:lipopolysaccharide biosynthesis protein n=1 Tax=Cognatishimia sp. MH4019 TaxID=2854030 RepID=UPI001CD3441A|nr:hypothetical protein [Cognatishimia sp. MH4019]